MNFYITSLAILLAFLDIVKACNTPIYAQRGPRGPPGQNGMPGTSMPPQSVTITVGLRKRRSPEIIPHAIFKFPIEAEELPEANIIVRKTINNFLQNIENKNELNQANQFRPHFSFEDDKLMVRVYVSLKESQECEKLIKQLSESKDEKTSIECV